MGTGSNGHETPSEFEELWDEIRKLRARVQELERMKSHQHMFEIPRYAEGKRLRTEGAREYEPAECPFP